MFYGCVVLTSLTVATLLAVFDLRQESTRHRPPEALFSRSPEAPLTPFHRAVAEVGRDLISDEVAALLPDSFDDAVEVVTAAASPRNVSSAGNGVYSLGPDAERRAATAAAKDAIRELHATARKLLQTTDVVTGTAVTVRLDGVSKRDDDSIVVIYLFERPDGGILLHARRSDPWPWFPL